MRDVQDISEDKYKKNTYKSTLWSTKFMSIDKIKIKCKSASNTESARNKEKVLDRL